MVEMLIQTYVLAKNDTGSRAVREIFPTCSLTELDLFRGKHHVYAGFR